MTPAVLLGTHVEVDDLVVRYGQRAALTGLDLKLDTGVHGLLGPNGAGKTTLIRVLAPRRWTGRSSGSVCWTGPTTS